MTLSPTALSKANKLKELIVEVGDCIEALNALGCIIELEVFFNEGSESVTLHRLNGEFNFEVGYYEVITDGR